MNIGEIDIREVLPQRPPMLMVGRMVSYEEPSMVTELTVGEDNIFLEDGRLLSSGIVENMAQSSAARIGYINKYILHLPVKVGYIGAVRNLRIFRNPGAGETLTTTVTALQEVFGITLVDAVVRVGEEVVASATLKTALGDKDAE